MTIVKKNWFVWLSDVFKVHPFVSGVIVITAFGVGYFVYGAVLGSEAAGASYIFGAVERKTIIASVSATGQVSAENEIDLKPKASGQLISVSVKAGDAVRVGQVIARLDSADALQNIADAEESLAEAKLQLQKDSAEAPINYDKALEARDDAKADLVTEYYDTFGVLSSSYIALPAVVTGLEDILYKYDLSASKSQWNIDVLKNLFNETTKEQATVMQFAKTAETDYKVAREKYSASLLLYKKTTRYSKGEELEEVLLESINMATAVAQALHSTLNLLDTIVDIASERSVTLNSHIFTMQSDAREYLSTANSQLNALLAQEKAVETTKRAIVESERNLSLLVIGNPNGDNPISLQSSKNNIAGQERDIQKLKADLADYTVTAPFAGTIASFDAKRFDDVGTGTILGTLITNQKIATLSLNEVDAAKIKVGNKVTLSFDAIDELTLTGLVSEIDALGAVSQGVVSYTIKIVFDAQDDRVKPGMTVNASIITDVRQDVLSVPSSAVKIQNGDAYVEVKNSGASTSEVSTMRVPVVVGITDDVLTEIISGLAEGDEVVVRTITATAANATGATAPSLFGGGGGARSVQSGSVNTVRFVR